MKRSRAIIIVTALCLMEMARCSTTIINIDRPAFDAMQTIAVMRFETAPGIPTNVSMEAEEAFRGHFIAVGKNVVEREKLRAILAEIEKTQAGMVSDPGRIGHLAGAEGLLFGTVTQHGEDVRWVTYYETKKDKNNPKKTHRVEKRKRMRYFAFQVSVRLVSTKTGTTILTMKSEYPERSYDIDSSMTLVRYREMVLSDMGRDLKKIIQEKQRTP